MYRQIDEENQRIEDLKDAKKKKGKPEVVENPDVIALRQEAINDQLSVTIDFMYRYEKYGDRFPFSLPKTRIVMTGRICTFCGEPKEWCEFPKDPEGVAHRAATDSGRVS